MNDRGKKGISYMTTGRLAPKIILFALPLAATAILQQLFNAADVAVVGTFVDKTAMAAVGCNTPIVNLLLNIFTGISLGANVVISRAIGAGVKDAVKRGVRTAVVISVAGGLIMALIGELIATPLIGMMSVPDEVLPMAITYLRIYAAGLPVIFLYNFESAIFRSKGDTLTPLFVLLASGLINIGLNLFFVIGLNLSVAGVALATIISNGVSAVLMFILLLTRKDEIKLTFDGKPIDGKLLKSMLKIGVPAGVQGAMFSVSNLVVQSGINSLGTDVMAAASAAFNIESIAYFVINAFGQAATTFTSQNLGAGKLDRCKRTVLLTNVIAILSSLVCAVILIIPGRFLLSLFNNDPAVIELGFIRLVMIALTEFINGINEIFSGILRGHGISLGPAIMTFLGVCVFRMIYIFTIFKAVNTFMCLMIVYPASWVITAILVVSLYFIKRKSLYSPKTVIEDN